MRRVVNVSLLKVGVILLAITCVFLCGNCVEAKSKKNADAIAAYMRYLRNECDNSYQFATIDVDNDGVKELYVTRDQGYHAKVYAYWDGGLKEIQDCFSGEFKYYKKKKIMYATTFHSGEWITRYTKVNKKTKTVKEVALAYGVDHVTEKGVSVVYKYYVQGKKTTKKKYNAYVKKLVKGQKAIYVRQFSEDKKAKKVALHDNTYAARTKYLK